MERVAALLTLVLLLGRAGFASEIRFAIIGDYGTDNAPARTVATLVSNLQPAFIVTLGDNNYGGPGDYDRMVGKYFARYLGNYTGAYGPGGATNEFFAAIGNHDYFSPGGYSAYTNYFALPGNERYYDVRRGPVHLFILNSDDHEPDGVSSTSIQAMWLSNRLAASPAPWKLVATHHAPYSSSGSAAAARWPYAEWGADIVLAGHSHNYERIEQDGFVYIVNGVGGAPLLEIDSPMPGSRVHFDDRYGAMLAIANEQEITFEFYSTEDAVVRDRFSLQRAQLNITWAEGGVDLVWPAQGTDRLRLESLRTGNWAIVTNTPVIRGSQKVVTVPLRTTREFFRLRAP